MHAKATGQSPVLHQRGSGAIHGSNGSVDRSRGGRCGFDGRHRMSDAVVDQFRGRRDGSRHRRCDESRVVAEHIAVSAQPRRPGHLRRSRHRLVLSRQFGKVEQRHPDLDTADTVGEGVVELAQHRRTSVLESVDQRDRPQRAGPVEVLHLGDPGDLEYPVEGARVRRRHPSDMEVEIEVRVVFPPWRRRRGDSTTHCRNIGSFRVTRSIRSRTSSQSGDFSSSRTVTTVDRSRGSLSIAQVNASVLRMNSVICTPTRKRTSSDAARQHTRRN